MRKPLLLLTLSALFAAPVALEAQGFGIAGRAGTLGLGVEGALGLGSSVVVRGGLGLMPLEPTTTIDDIEFTVGLPDNWYNVGADFYLGGSFRIGAGMLFKPDDPTLTGELSGTASVTIGDKTYTRSDVAVLNGVLDSKDSAPYVVLGFGKHTSSGVGLFLDLGAGFMGEPEVLLSAEGDPTIVNSAEFQAELRKQEQQTEDDLGSYLKVWPIINLGVKIGLGG